MLNTARNGISANVRFSIKCLIQNYPLAVLFGFMVPSFFLFAAVLRVFERPYTDVSQIDFQSFWNALWCVAATISTIGYGDIFPGTHFGRMVAVLCGMWGVFIFSMIVVALESSYQMNHAEKKTFQTMNIKQAALSAVIEALRLNLVQAYYGPKSLGTQQQKKELELSLYQYQAVMRKVKYKQGEYSGLVKDNYHKLKRRLNLIEQKLDRLLEKSAQV